MAAGRVALRVAATRLRPGVSRPRERKRGTTRRRTGSSCAAAASASRTEEERGTLGLEGTIYRRLSAQKGGRGAWVRAQPSDQDVVAAVDDLSAICRANLRGLQRPQIHPGAGDREHDRSQARRIRADPHLLRPRRRQEGAKEL